MRGVDKRVFRINEPRRPATGDERNRNPEELLNVRNNS